MQQEKSRPRRQCGNVTSGLDEADEETRSEREGKEDEIVMRGLPPPGQIALHRKMCESGCEDAVQDGLLAADGGSSKQERVCVAFTFF